MKNHDKTESQDLVNALREWTRSNMDAAITFWNGSGVFLPPMDLSSVKELRIRPTAGRTKRGQSLLQLARVSIGGPGSEHRIKALAGGTEATWPIHEHTRNMLEAFHVGELQETIRAAGDAGIPVKTAGDGILKSGGMGGYLVRMFIDAVTAGDADLIKTIANAVESVHERAEGQGKDFHVKAAKPALMEIVKAAEDPANKDLSAGDFYGRLSFDTRMSYENERSVDRIRKEVMQGHLVKMLAE